MQNLIIISKMGFKNFLQSFGKSLKRKLQHIQKGWFDISLSKDLTVKASVGLHARPAAEFVKLAQQFNGTVTIDKNGNEVDGKSMIGILKLAIKQGETFQLTIDGEDEDAFMKQFEELVNKDD